MAVTVSVGASAIAGDFIGSLRELSGVAGEERRVPCEFLSKYFMLGNSVQHANDFFRGNELKVNKIDKSLCDASSEYALHSSVLMHKSVTGSRSADIYVCISQGVVVGFFGYFKNIGL